MKSIRKCTILMLAMSLMVIAGCGYGSVSPRAYELAKGIYNISNRKLGDRLPDIRKQIELAQQEQAISDQEARWLTGITAKAEAGKWKQSMTAARRMMEDQVEQ